MRHALLYGIRLTNDAHPKLERILIGVCANIISTQFYSSVTMVLTGLNIVSIFADLRESEIDLPIRVEQ